MCGRGLGPFVHRKSIGFAFEKKVGALCLILCGPSFFESKGHFGAPKIKLLCAFGIGRGLDCWHCKPCCGLCCASFLAQSMECSLTDALLGEWFAWMEGWYALIVFARFHMSYLDNHCVEVNFPLPLGPPCCSFCGIRISLRSCHLSKLEVLGAD